MQPPKPHSDVKQCNATVKHKIWWNAAGPPSSRETKKYLLHTHRPGCAADPPETWGTSPGQRGPALSGGVGGRGDVARQPVSRLVRSTDPAHPAKALFFCLTAHVT